MNKINTEIAYFKYSPPYKIFATVAFLVLSAISPKAFAQYASSVNPLSPSWPLPTENTLNFSSTAPDQSYSCSFGGGTRSMVYAGLFSGIDQTYVQNEVTTMQGESFSLYPSTQPYSHGLGAGIIVPLKSSAERTLSKSCIRIMSLVEAEEVMNLLDKFKSKGVITATEYDEKMVLLKDRVLEIAGAK